MREPLQVFIIFTELKKSDDLSFIFRSTLFMKVCQQTLSVYIEEICRLVIYRMYW